MGGEHCGVTEKAKQADLYQKQLKFKVFVCYRRINLINSKNQQQNHQMCLFPKDWSNKKILNIFFAIALILLLPFLIVSLTLAYEKSQDYCLGYAGMEQSGIHGVTLRHWLQVDGFTRLVFLVFAIFFFFAARHLADHYALVTVESNIFRIYYFFLLGWMIFGAVLFWGNVQKAPIFNSIPTRNTYEDPQIFNRNFSFDLSPSSHFPRPANIDQLEYVARKNSQNYYDYQRFDRGPWYHQELIPQWNSSSQSNGQPGLNHYQLYQKRYTKDGQPIQGFRIGCKPRVSVYMWILLISHLILLPLVWLLLGLRSRRTRQEYVDYNHHGHVNTHQRPGTNVQIVNKSGYQNNRFVAHPPVYTDPPASGSRLR